MRAWHTTIYIAGGVGLLFLGALGIVVYPPRLAEAWDVGASATLTKPMVWRSVEAQHDGYRVAHALIREGRFEPRAIAPYLACEPREGSRVTIMKVIRGLSAEVVVLEGPDAGCRGVVLLDDLRP